MLILHFTRKSVKYKPMTSKKTSKFRLVVLCGGPSMERGISLNSCRSVCDNLESPEIDIQPVYFDYRRQAYTISRGALYSNTPSDFDFKLQNGGKSSVNARSSSSSKTPTSSFQSCTEPSARWPDPGNSRKTKARYVGSPSQACKIAFNKYKSNELINSHDFPSLPSSLLKSHSSKKKTNKLSRHFSKTSHLTCYRETCLWRLKYRRPLGDHAERSTDRHADISIKTRYTSRYRAILRRERIHRRHSAEPLRTSCRAHSIRDRNLL